MKAARWAGSGAIMALVLAVAACDPTPPAPPPFGHTSMPGPGRDTVHMTTAQRTAFNAYVATLNFDTMSAVSDMQKLADSATLVNTGPLAKISPRQGVWAQDSSSL